MTKKIIGQGFEFRVLYTLEVKISRPTACPGTSTPFEERCQLGHPSLTIIKISLLATNKKNSLLTNVTDVNNCLSIQI